LLFQLSNSQAFREEPIFELKIAQLAVGTRKSYVPARKNPSPEKITPTPYFTRISKIVSYLAIILKFLENFRKSALLGVNLGNFSEIAMIT
ncbi:MAG: hypothetical protein MJ098_09065, partial [Saccharofermentans sp.]|nr:hypothetical protein [Saccharofermentans sp.]